jgi:malate dehydrogenase (oxaloacetate-decarboxylating)(NADP+)
MLESLNVGTVLGPILMGLEKPVEIVHMNSTVAELVNASAFAAHESMRREITAKPKRARKAKAAE